MRAPNGYVYVLRAVRSELLKVGCSVAPELRVSDMGVRNQVGERPLFLGKVRGNYGLERTLHLALGPWRVKGEWFEDRAEVWATLREMMPKADWVAPLDRGTVCPTCGQHTLASGWKNPQDTAVA